MRRKIKGPDDAHGNVSNEIGKTKNTEGLSELDETTGNDTLNEVTPPSVKGEQSVSGDMPDPGSDDDVSKMANDVGLYTDEKEGKPMEVNVAGEVQKSEEEFEQS